MNNSAKKAGLINLKRKSKLNDDDDIKNLNNSANEEDSEDSDSDSSI